MDLTVPQVDPDRSGRDDVPAALSTRVKFREAARRVGLEERHHLKKTYHLSCSSCLYILCHSLQAGNGLPTAEDAYNFFTFNFEPEPQDETVSTSRKRQKPKKAADEDRGEEGGEEVEEQEEAEEDEDNQDENEDQVSEKR